MADAFRIIPPQVRAEGKDVPPEQIQAGLNSLANQTTAALNAINGNPTGPAGGDLSGNYPNPTVTQVNGSPAGTMANQNANAVAITGGTITGLSSPLGVMSGGTGQNALNAHNVMIGEGSSAVGFAAPGATAGVPLVSTGSTTDPSFGTASVAGGGTGRTTLLAHGVLVGEGTAGINQLAVGNTGQMLLGSTGADPGFGNNPTITGGSINGPIPITTTQAITPSSTAGIVGTTAADNANAGSVGELITQTATGTSVTSATTANATSISLTAGDWDVSGVVRSSPAAGTTIQQQVGGISTTSATLGAFGTFSNDTYSPAAGTGETHPTPVVRVNVSATTTVYLVTTMVFSGGTLAVDGLIRARRVR